MGADLLALNRRAADILQAAMPAPAPVLLLEAAWPLVDTAMDWRRRGTQTNDTVWQQDFAGALLGLPRAREELAMNLHLATARLLPEAPLVLFGLKEAGIAAAEKLLTDIFEEVTLALTKHHGRVFLARAPRRAGLIESVEDWRRADTATLLGQEYSLVSYPGLFAGGQLDAGTALLLRQLPQLAIPSPRLVLDFACGIGVLGLAARQQWPQAALHLLDHDALALRAARHNLSGKGATEFMQAEDLSAVTARYDLVLSNPPIHDGNRLDYGVTQRLVEAAPRYLAARGQLLLVTQQTVPVQRWANVAECVTQEQGFKVWRVGQGG